MSQSIPQTHPAITSLRESITKAQAELDDLTAQRKAKRAQPKRYARALSDLTGEARTRKTKQTGQIFRYPNQHHVF